MTSRRTVLRGLAGGAVGTAGRLAAGAGGPLARTGPLLLRAAPAVTVAPLAAGCVPGRDAVQVVVVWNGRELELFRRVLEHFGDGDRPPIQLISAGNGIKALLRSRIAAGHPPHIAVLPRPGLLQELLAERPDSLEPLDAEAAATVDQYTPAAWQRLTTVRGRQYGVWLKATHKSVFWHRLSPGFAESYQPETLTALMEDLSALARAGTQPLSIGAADGWVLTDWFENALLAVAPEAYDRLVAGEGSWRSEAVTEALTWLARIWRIPDVFPGGPQRALLTQYDEAALEIFVRRRGPGLTFEGDFVATVLRPYQQQGKAPSRLGAFQFPPAAPAPGVGEPAQPIVVGGDAAVLMRTGNHTGDRNARALMRWLAGLTAAQLLSSAGFLTVNSYVRGTRHIAAELPRDSNLPDLLGDLAAQLRGQPVLRFDLSDQLRGDLAGGDGQGMWRLLQDFFADVTRPHADSAESVRRVQRRLAEAASQYGN